MTDERVTSEQRAQVIERARGCGEYCSSQSLFSTQSFSVEPIVPRSKGVATAFDNLALARQGCNNHKYSHTDARDPLSEQTVPLYHPRQHDWSEHFAWNDDYTLLIGLTPTGHATVQALQLNREGVVNLRRALFAFGRHPPPRGAATD